MALNNAAAMQEQAQKAMALHQEGKPEKAVKIYKKLLSQAPNHPELLNLCAMASADAGALQNAIRFLKKALAAAPAFHNGWLNLGVLQQRSGKLPDAKKSYQEFIKLAPNEMLGYRNLGNVYQLLKEYGKAVEAYEKAHSKAPEDIATLTNLTLALVQQGEWQKVVEATDKTLALKTGNTASLTFKATALNELERGDEARELVDFNRFIEQVTFKPPEGYDNMNAFNEALVKHCLNHKSLTYEPSDNTTMKGHQTGNLSLDDNQGPIAHLLELINQAVLDYQEKRKGSGSHPFLDAMPDNWTFDIWATVLGSQGHQASHIHRDGWLSGCYYAKIPDVVKENYDDKAGWIEFGTPQENQHLKAEPDVTAYKPEEGMVVLFPSYFYHRTVPFISDEKRISIAFDIVPKG